MEEIVKEKTKGSIIKDYFHKSSRGLKRAFGLVIIFTLVLAVGIIYYSFSFRTEVKVIEKHHQ